MTTDAEGLRKSIEEAVRTSIGVRWPKEEATHFMGDPQHSFIVNACTTAVLGELAAREGRLRELMAKYRRYARADCDPANGSASLQKQGRLYSTIADELEAALGAPLREGEK